MKLYNELAAWWPLLSAPEDYAEEAEFYRNLLQKHLKPAARRLLELGSGGGNNALHLKPYFQMTLVDLSEGMLEVSRNLNPECEHLQGDMRLVRLGRTFDAVFVHDAVMYMITQADLRSAMQTAFVHLEPGGAALFAPDWVRETFVPGTSHGGHDGEGRGLRYLEWVYDPDPNDTAYVVEFAYLLREGNQTWVEHDRHYDGIFPRADWLRLLAEVGFEAPEPVVDGYGRDLFIGVKPAMVG